MAYPLTNLQVHSVQSLIISIIGIHIFLQLSMTGGVKHAIVSSYFVISGRLCNIIVKIRLNK